MPTPFTHLRLLADLLDPADNWLPPAVADRLDTGRGPFLLGGTAPDVRKISPVSREETHFYPIPPDPSRPSMETMLRAWPSLEDPAKLEPDHAAFVAGYLAHLWFDEYWHQMIVYPYYVQRDDWSTHRGRFNVYNVLNGYLEFRDRALLDDNLGGLLQSVNPDNWLPFVSDSDLIEWRDFLAGQLHLGVPTRTGEILAQRARMSQRDYLALVADEDRMEHKVLIHTPRGVIKEVYTDGLAGSARVVVRYLEGDKQ